MPVSGIVADPPLRDPAKIAALPTGSGQGDRHPAVLAALVLDAADLDPADLAGAADMGAEPKLAARQFLPGVWL